jgi:hypothetical protein
MSAISVFNQIKWWVSTISSRVFPKNKPGEVIERLSPEERQQLSQLKSEEINESLRLDEYWKHVCQGDKYYYNKEVEELKESFDKKVLKK